ncbi:hypothetical protein Nepgr_024264 [Nepenthes gracilis]|uniref:Uncharacterized protein n=1 Tax=Nepenthes gracilis TaxID=150966 RepID=A0AAD3T4D0_NEPGR|nr:hypothetical protein Nepgr_024264 [Nepenthes gracilis]
MERSEPSLVPEWLKSSGGGSSSHHFASSHSDGPLLALPKRNRSSKSIDKNDAPHSSFLDRSFSNSRRTTSSNGSTKHDKNYLRSYASFNRNQRDTEKKRLNISDNWDAEYADPLRSMLYERTEEDTLRRSQTMIPRMQGEEMQQRVSTDSRSGKNNDIGNGGLSVGDIVTGIKKVTFNRDFPSLVSGERPSTPELSRVPSPVFNRGAQSLSIGKSALISREGWTSALAEVPMGVGSSSIGSSPSLQPSAPAPLSGATTASITSGLNMAEALTQAPSGSHTASQPSVQTQRFEELAVLQSKRLIPMTHSMPKSSVLSPSDKLKPKTAPRTTEPVVTSKNGQLVSLQPNNHFLRGGNTGVDGPKTSHSGKLLVLKPERENGVTPASRDGNDLSTSSPSFAPVSLKNPRNPKIFSVERKPQVQSRTDFFNSVRKKSMNSTSVSADSGAVVSSVKAENLGEQHKDMAGDLVSPYTKNDGEVQCNGDAHEPSFCHTTNEEEEAAFMRSLGWDPNAGDDEGLTEEEINSFCQTLIKLRPTSKLILGLPSKMLTPSEPQATSSDGAPSGFNAADSTH